MLKQETYEDFAEGFATSIGVAQTIGFGDVESGGVEPSVYRRFSSDMNTNRIICKAIDGNLYQKLQRNIYRIEKSDKRLKENTIIKRAWEETQTHGKKRINTTSGEILKGN